MLYDKVFIHPQEKPVNLIEKQLVVRIPFRRLFHRNGAYHLIYRSIKQGGVNQKTRCILIANLTVYGFQNRHYALCGDSSRSFFRVFQARKAEEANVSYGYRPLFRPRIAVLWPRSCSHFFGSFTHWRSGTRLSTSSSAHSLEASLPWLHQLEQWKPKQINRLNDFLRLCHFIKHASVGLVIAMRSRKKKRT